MANIYTGNPIVLDTDVALGDFPNYFNCRVKIAHFEFVGYAVDTDSVSITDRNDDLVWQATGYVDLTNVVSQDIGWVNGIGVVSLGGSTGKILMYVRP